MAKYRKLPVVIDAEPYREGLEDGWDLIQGGLVGCPNLYKRRSKMVLSEALKHIVILEAPYINTLEGKHYISEGDYIITGIAGERYPCKTDIFEAIYELVEE